MCSDDEKVRIPVGISSQQFTPRHAHREPGRKQVVKLNSTLPAIRGLYLLITQDESLREPRIEQRLIARLLCVDHNFIPSYLLKHKPSHHLHMHPPRHPSLRNLLRLINQPHIQQKLRSTPNSALKCREDPSVRVARVFAN